MLISIPHLELLGIIGCIGIASVAAWSSAAVNMRMRMLERDIDDLYDDIRAVREEQVYLQQYNQPSQASVAVASPQRSARPARRSTPLARPTQPAMLPSLSHQFAPGSGVDREVVGESVGTRRPNVTQLAAQLAAQTPEQMDEVLTPAIDLAGSYSTIGAGRQESRLLRWMNGVTGQFSTLRQ